MKKATNFKNQRLLNLVGPTVLKLIFTFKLALTLDTPNPSRHWTHPTRPEHP